MNDKKSIEEYNYAAKDAYKRKLREKKGENLSPLREEPTTDTIRNTKNKEFNLKAMTQTIPVPVQTATNEWLMRATVGGTQNANRSSKTLESMLNNCCVLMNMKQFDVPTSPESSLRATLPIKKNGSNSLIGKQVSDKSGHSSNIVINDQSSGSKTPIGKPLHGIQEIEKHNQLYKKNRSSSHSRGQGSDRARPSEFTTIQKGDLSSDVPYLHPPKPNTEKAKKPGHLLTSFKDIINKGPFKNFGRKKTSDRKEEQLYDCECNKDKKLRKINWQSNTGCVRSVGWLRNKYNPTAAYEELKDFFNNKMAEKTASPTIKEDIQKDVVRTFNNNRYLGQETTKKRLEILLECVALTYPHTSYVQGMNFIAGTLLYHCDEYISLGVIKILFEQLELKDMFLPSSLE